MQARWKISSIILLLLISAAALQAADWPMWRGGPSRGGASGEALPADLHLRWTRELPAPAPAWPDSQEKLQYDAGYEPIVAGGRLFIGSMAEDTVCAYDTETGERLWRFFTDGPVRFAPAAWEGRLYAGSDDGWLYCLDQETGKLLWKFDGAPRQRRVLGNGRLISTWPVRGGPVVYEGKVYFTCGIWPFMGIFIHAVDADTGERIWTNGETGAQWTVHPHGAPSFGSIVPQGYLAAAGDYLFVPGGRSLPAVFDRNTGKMLHFDFGGKGSGGYDVAAGEQFYFVGDEMFAAADGAKLAAARADVLSDDYFLTADSGTIAVTATTGKLAEKSGVDRKGNPTTSRSFSPESVRRIAVDGAGGEGNVFITAGERLYVGREGSVAAYELSGKSDEKRDPSWTAEIEGRAFALAAADGKLFVSTDQGKLYCFGEKADSVTVYASPIEALRERIDYRSRQTLEIHAGTSSIKGYGVQFVDDADLLPSIYSQMQNMNLHDVVVFSIMVCSDGDIADQLRREFSDNGLYGKRISVHVGNPFTFGLPPYFAAGVVYFGPDQEVLDEGKRLAQVLYRAARPYGGEIGVLLHSEEQKKKFVNDARAAELPGAEIGEDLYAFINRPGPLPDSAPWTHQYADAAQSVVSHDKLVQAPLGLLWFGGPSNDKVLPRHGHGPSPQVAGGRLFIEGPDMLRAVDVYTGLLLWEKELPGLGKYYDITAHFAGAGEIGSNYVSLEDRVYVAYGDELLELDAASGDTLHAYQLAAEKGKEPPLWGYLAADGGLLIAASSPVSVEGAEAPADKAELPAGGSAIVKQGAAWSYLAGSDPADDWIAADFDDSAWKIGKAGIGYGDGDDATELSDMRGKYTRVYARIRFDAKKLSPGEKLSLLVNYDDAFIAYLNGREIVRAGVKKGRGKSAEGIESHEADGFERFEIEDAGKLLREGENVLAIEGHNDGSTSSDFSLHPVLAAEGGAKTAAGEAAPRNESGVAGTLREVPYSSASRRLAVFDRASRELLWSREATFNFRHNAISAAGGRIYCIDGMSPEKLKSLARRGIEPAESAELLALDGRSGDVVWSTRDNVAGTFLNYSAEHDVLLVAGSAFRDRARDELGVGMAAYRGTDGALLWRDDKIVYGGPCLLWRDKIITNGNGGFQLNLLNGEKTGWGFSRMYGCNTVVGSEHLLTFRSGAAGYCDLAGDGGTGNIGGFRSSCTANLIAADGVLSAPDYTRTCTCAYQNQTSLALIHDPQVEMWTFGAGLGVGGAEATRLGINFGAPGDRRDAAGTLWLDWPSVGGYSHDVKVNIKGGDVRYFQRHVSALEDAEEATHPWVASSGVIGAESIEIELPFDTARSGKFLVRLHFSEPEELPAGERAFDVAVAGRPFVAGLDIALDSGGPRRELIKELRIAPTGDTIQIALSARRGATVLCGVEIVAE